jgi:hypothetical protein
MLDVRMLPGGGGWPQVIDFRPRQNEKGPGNDRYRGLSKLTLDDRPYMGPHQPKPCVLMVRRARTMSPVAF